MSKSVVIFLAGHGAVSSRGTMLGDQHLRSHHVIFPAKPKGELCFVAHNMILQSLINANSPIDPRDPSGPIDHDKPYDKLQTLERVHGVSAVDVHHRQPVQVSNTVLNGDCIVDLRDVAQRGELQHFLQRVNAILRVMDSVQRANLDDIFQEQDFTPLQCGIFEGVNLKACFGTGTIQQIKTDIEKLLESTVLLEHKLGTWDKSMATYPWQREMAYSPSDIHHTITSLSDRAVNNKQLKLCIDQNKLQIAVSKLIACKEDQLNPHTVDETQVLHLTTSSPQPVFLSQILDILHKVHIYVSAQKAVDADGVVSVSNAQVRYIYAIDDPEDISLEMLKSSEESSVWYDYTIPDDANVVWGACRVTEDF